MTEEIQSVTESSSENSVTNNCSNTDQEFLKTEKDYHTELIDSIIRESPENISLSDMTKNKDCENTTDNNEEKIIVDSDKKESSIESVDCQNSSDKVLDEESETGEQISNDNSEKVKTEENERQSSVEDKSRPDPYSYSEWSENYESLDDDRPIEDVIDDPQKYILWAAEKNELETVRKLLEEDPNLVNAKDNDLYTPLHRASYSNSVEVIKILLSFDADISARTTDGWEPLHCACKWDSVEAVSLLLQNGADINARTQGNITPLHLAASNVSGRRTLEFLLWQPYIDPNVKNDAGDTAYDIAYRTGPLGDLFELLDESVNEY